MELKFENRNDFLKADSLIEEMENKQKDKLVSSKISLATLSKTLLYKAMIKFY